MSKLIKDIVHGYIELESDYIKLIDSPEFQRLRNIRQTSYSSLYPSSLHDRFSHSLGVYALGKYAFTNFKKNVQKDYCNCDDVQTIDWDKKENIFLRACLLHDIGHAPFSHTGEDFYLLKQAKKSKLSKSSLLYKDLVDSIKNNQFTDDFDSYQLQKGKIAAPHEIMSAIVGINSFFKKWPSEDKSLFARMIIGLRYPTPNNFDVGVNNALIQLLNSSVIDVDRLDYLIRDRLMTGFQNALIDTDRLLSSVCLVNNSTDNANPQYHLGFYKNALSSIENVVVAHDSERKWIQSHSVVEYESFLIRKMIEGIESTYGDGNEVFSRNALSEGGVKIYDKTNNANQILIRYLSDADVIFLAKQIPAGSEYRTYIDEYFARALRKKAVWKFESEYDLMLREIGEADRKRILNWINALVDDLRIGDMLEEKSVTINEMREIKLRKENEVFQQQDSISQKDKDDKKNFTESILDRMKVFHDMADHFHVKYDFVISYIKPFDSNVEKLISNDVLIKHKNFELPKPIGEVISTYSQNKSSVLGNDDIKRIYFVFYKKNDKYTIKPLQFINYLKDKIK